MVVFWVMKSPTLFDVSASKTFLIYRADGALNHSQKEFFQKKLNLEPRFKDEKIFDEDYVNVLALNDEKVLADISLMCGIPSNLKPYNRKLTIRRQKSFDYFVIDFTNGMQQYADCIVNSFNKINTAEKLKKYTKRALEIRLIINTVEDIGVKTELYSVYKYYNYLIKLLSVNETIYTFLELSEEHENDSSSSINLKIFLLINLLLALIFFKKLISRNK